MNKARKDNFVILRLDESPTTARQLEHEGIISMNYFSKMKKRLILNGMIQEKILDGRTKEISLTEKGSKFAKKLNKVFV